jgi:uncharacterized protein (TIGR00369 family)
LTPPDPGYAARTRESFAAQGAMAHLGAELAEVSPGRCVVALPFRPELTQQDGFFHGGVVTTIADSAAGFAAFTLMPPGARVLSVELKINFLAPARGERLLATGRVERAGRTLSVVQARVEAIEGGTATEVAILMATMFCAMPSPAPG